MTTYLPILIAMLLAYLLGSVPFAVVFAKLFCLNDPRRYGSGNPGATNILRSGNHTAAVLTLFGDLGKGAIAVLTAHYYFTPQTTPVLLVALCVFLGHLYPLFLRFRGGKGVATAAGVLLALDWRLGLLVIAVWLTAVYLFRYSSLAALLAALSAPLYLLLTVSTVDGQLILVSSIAFILIYRHRDNIYRLMSGQESKISHK